MSLWRVTVVVERYENQYEDVTVLVLANTEIGAKKVATGALRDGVNYGARSTEAVEINAYRPGVILTVPEREVWWVRQEDPVGI